MRRKQVSKGHKGGKEMCSAIRIGSGPVWIEYRALHIRSSDTASTYTCEKTYSEVDSWGHLPASGFLALVGIYINMTMRWKSGRLPGRKILLSPTPHMASCAQD